MKVVYVLALVTAVLSALVIWFFRGWEFEDPT